MNYLWPHPHAREPLPLPPSQCVCLFVCRFPGDGFFAEDRDEERPDAFRRMDIADLRHVVFSYIPVGAPVRCAHPSFLGSRTPPPPHPSPPCPPPTLAQHES
jgi:hypothetical protein